MSLVDKALKDFVIMDATTTPDGYGGYTQAYKEGAGIKASLRFDDSMEARTAMALGVTSVYTIITKKDVLLPYHTILKDVEDKVYYRITSDSSMNKTPESAGLNMRAASAEKWELVGEVETSS